MKIIFKCCGFEKTVYYVEQTPEKVIESDFQDWCKRIIIMNSEWKYGT
jgi:hypothetical protein